MANAGVAHGVLGNTAFLVGGENRVRPVPTVTELRLVPPAAAIPPATPGSRLDARRTRALADTRGTGGTWRQSRADQRPLAAAGAGEGAT